MKYLLLLLMIFAMPKVLLGQDNSGVWVTESSVGFDPREFLTSSVVNGKIYVIGGRVNKDSFPDAIQIFDPATNLWSNASTTGNFTPRERLTSSVVGGVIYVFGGDYGGKDLNVLEMFDPSTNTWATPKTTGSPGLHSGHSAIVYDGKIYIIGGTSDTTKSIEIFDPSINSWSVPNTTGSFTPRHDLSSCIINEKIYAMGGFDASANALNTFEVFDLLTNQWSTPKTSGAFSSRGQLTSSVLNNKIYALGGANINAHDISLNTVETYDPSTNIWSTPHTTGNFSARCALTSCVVGNKIFALGGYIWTRGCLNTNEVFTPTINTVKLGVRESKISLSPNPVTDILTVQNVPSDIIKVEIVNVIGKIMFVRGNIGNPDFTLDLSKLIPGTYYIRFVSAKSTITKMVVKD